MIYSVIVIAIAAFIIYFVLSRTLFPLIRVSRMKKRLLEEGVEAPGILLNVEQTGLFVNNQPQLKMQVKVQSSSGRNFVSEAKEVVALTDLVTLRAGAIILVRYNPGNTKELTLVRK